uniref:DNA ligase homolog protein n=1 Tax=Abalone asfa-like virus TaxID=2839893 RepID=A0A5K7XZ99_9VIRU|nr:DNA ligase homolog protein [Abalone asfa-like virus]BCY04585.1 Putative DNA ligase [Abalone asfa-like virus]
MASKSVYLFDINLDIKNGIIPGTFDVNCETFTFPDVVTLNSRGAEMIWRLSVKLYSSKTQKEKLTKKWLGKPTIQCPETYCGCITTVSYQSGGKIRDTVPIFIFHGKNIGKKNETNCIQQAFRLALSKYNLRQKQANLLNQTINFPPPMLVKRYEKNNNSSTVLKGAIPPGTVIQKKLNGVRLVACFTDKVILYSRKGLEYPGLDHIKTNLKQIFQKDKHIYLDGECYLHGKPLQWISGQSRKDQDEGLLEYHIFDCFWPVTNPTAISEYRQVQLKKLLVDLPPNIKYVDSEPVSSISMIEKITKKYLKDGYEGGIVRFPAGVYTYGYSNHRSSDIIKVKPLYDKEFKIVGFTSGIIGKDVGALVWICEVEDAPDPNDKIFHVVPKNMTYAERYKIFKCLSQLMPCGQTRFMKDFYGKYLTVEYPELSTKTGKPVQAKALEVRTYESGKEDVMAKLFKEC